MGLSHCLEVQQLNPAILLVKNKLKPAESISEISAPRDRDG